MFPNTNQAVISVHWPQRPRPGCGANFLEAGWKNGARQPECTINGIGERAATPSLEELWIGPHVRRQLFHPFLAGGQPQSIGAISPDRRTRELTKPRRTGSNLTGMNGFQPNKRSSVATMPSPHRIGHPTRTARAARTLYLTSIIDARTNRPSDTPALPGSSVAARSGPAGRSWLTPSTPTILAESFAAFKELADRKRTSPTRDLESDRQRNMLQQLEAVFTLSCAGEHRQPLQPTATVTWWNADGGERTTASIATRPVDAVCTRALKRVGGGTMELVNSASNQ